MSLTAPSSRSSARPKRRRTANRSESGACHAAHLTSTTVITPTLAKQYHIRHTHMLYIYIYRVLVTLLHSKEYFYILLCVGHLGWLYFLNYIELKHVSGTDWRQKTTDPTTGWIIKANRTFCLYQAAVLSLTSSSWNWDFNCFYNWLQFYLFMPGNLKTDHIIQYWAFLKRFYSDSGNMALLLIGWIG